MRGIALVGGMALALGAGAAHAQDPALKDLNACRAISDLAAKAACYDAASGALNQAVDSGELVLVRKKEVQAARRGAFGFNLPSLSFLDRKSGSEAKLEKRGGEARSGDVRKEREDDANDGVNAITATVKQASTDSLGHWIIVLDDGAVWRQTDNEVLSPRPRAGSKVEIRRAALGSYMMKLDKLRPVRAKRVE